ncbi:MAG TPA: fluoride efflux transporter CrcB [Gemmatimonadaceae bacterium]|nr:fluoride efflux transporter CrcB [Gemmatimonadaceae bacterium]
MLSVWFVALGSAAGGVTRYLLSGAVQRAAGGPFPAGTLLVNVSGSFLLGFLLRYTLAVPAVTPELRLGLTAGFCGGYTTFSTFSAETVTLVEGGDYRRAALYALTSLVVSILAAALGFAAARALTAGGVD